MDRRQVKVMKFTKQLFIAVMSVLLALYASGLLSVRRGAAPPVRVVRYDSYWDHVLNHYGIPFLQFCITSLYRLYIKFTVFNVLVFSMKYLPSGIYMYKFMTSVYRTSRERLRMKQIELEDLVLEIAMVKTKQVVRETECTELMAKQGREAARLRDMRARVLDLVATDDSLRKLLDTFAVERPNPVDYHSTNEDQNLMKLLSNENLAVRLSENVDEPKEQISVSGKSEFSSVSEAEVEKDCQIKIIEVTNVYKVAYLKHYIKQKRIRRASRHALLKKKMATMKKLLESWQKSLNMVMKDHQYILRREIDTSEDISASRPHSDTDTAIDEYNPDWDQPYKNYYRDSEITDCSDDYRCHEYNDHYYGNCFEEVETSMYEEQDNKYESERAHLPRLTEETSSQLLALQDSKLDHNEANEFL